MGFNTTHLLLKFEILRTNGLVNFLFIKAVSMAHYAICIYDAI